MNIHPEDLCEEIADAMTTDDFSFYAAGRAEQNVEVDELEAPIIFLDPIVSKDKPRASGYIENFIPLKLFFLWDSELDGKQKDTLQIRKTAFEAAKEFVHRLMRHEQVKKVELGNSERLEVYNFTDRNLCGCSLAITITIHDDQGTCTT